MQYKVIDDNIIIQDLSQFNIKHILECGQIFTYEKISDFDYIVFSNNEKAVVKLYNNEYIIKCSNINYFVNFFDLDTDYNEIKKLINNNPLLNKAIEFGYGIRIVKQNLLETIISFVISANNNIKRIIKTMSKLRTYGTKKQDYYCFPTLKQLAKITNEQFRNMGAGYRSDYLVKLINQLQNIDLEKTKFLDNLQLKKWLISLMGIGNKVADCILLFGYNRYNYFPVDTWNEKLYVLMFNEKPSRLVMSQKFCDLYKNYSGYAQQYLFHYIRSGLNGKNM